MRRIITTALIALIAIPAFAASEPKSEEEKTIYSVGLVIARQLSVFNLTPAELELVLQGLSDGMTGRTPLVDVNVYSRKTQQLATARRDGRGGKLATAAKEFLDKASKERGAVKTGSGLVYLPLKEGSGNGPSATDRVKVNCRGTLVDGTEFDSSKRRGQPDEFPLNEVVACLTEGVQMMKPGGKARLVCPPEIAYGKDGSGIIPANATLVYEVELLGVTK